MHDANNLHSVSKTVNLHTSKAVLPKAQHIVANNPFMNDTTPAALLYVAHQVYCALVVFIDFLDSNFVSFLPDLPWICYNF